MTERIFPSVLLLRNRHLADGTTLRLSGFPSELIEGNLLSSYTRDLQRHLGQYKATRLGVTEAGAYLHKGKEVRHAHILPKELRWLNILESYRTEIYNYVHAHKDVRLHRHFHHLNSSQALALNVFFPFFEGSGSASSGLLRTLGVPGELKRWRCEYLPDPKEKTNVDIAWETADGDWTYCEVKLSEQEFGQAEGEPRHLRKLDKTYSPILRSHCSNELLDPTFFFKHYQILRNVWLAARKPGGRALFILPSRNKALWAPLARVLDGLDSSLRKRIHVVKLEEILAGLVHDKHNDQRLKLHAEQLTEKYVLRAASPS